MPRRHRARSRPVPGNEPVDQSDIRPRPPGAARVLTPHPYDGRLSVVVPVRNEAENIEPLAREIADALAKLPAFEIVYVDDGSDDGTRAELERMRACIPELRCVRHARSCGQSAAILTGVRSARHPWIATLDGDGQNDPADLPRLLDRLASARPEENLHMLAG
jgi:dolichol-phosphate mannosyltransferase